LTVNTAEISDCVSIYIVPIYHDELRTKTLHIVCDVTYSQYFLFASSEFSQFDEYAVQIIVTLRCYMFICVSHMLGYRVRNDIFIITTNTNTHISREWLATPLPLRPSVPLMQGVYPVHSNRAIASIYVSEL